MVERERETERPFSDEDQVDVLPGTGVGVGNSETDVGLPTIQLLKPIPQKHESTKLSIDYHFRDQLSSARERWLELRSHDGERGKEKEMKQREEKGREYREATEKRALEAEESKSKRSSSPEKKRRNSL